MYGVDSIDLEAQKTREDILSLMYRRKKDSLSQADRRQRETAMVELNMEAYGHASVKEREWPHLWGLP